MKSPTHRIQRQLARLRTMIPPGDDLGEFAARTLDEQIASVAPDTPMGIVPPSILSKTQMLASARIAVELIDIPDQLAAKPEGIIDLGVIEWLLRPALPLKNDVFETVESGIWKDLASDAVRRQASAVCRLDISLNESDPIHIGTGFVAGEDKSGRLVIATNAHVVEEVLRIGWPADQHIVFGCDFSRFAVDIGGDLYAVDEEYELHPRYDLAFLHLRSEFILSGGGVRPLPIASHAPEQLIDSRIGVIGHPAFDSRLDPFPKFFGFGNEFGMKRFSPGFVRSLDERVWRGSNLSIVLHDATTLSGSSGSCIVDLDTMHVMGLHFGGWPLQERKVATHAGDLVAQLFESNGAVPLWTLHEDPLCSALSFT
jgi:hypothetical protein